MSNRHRSLVGSATGLSALATLPGVLFAAAWLLLGETAVELRISAFVVCILAATAAVLKLRVVLQRSFTTIHQALEALLEGEYTVRTASHLHDTELRRVIDALNGLSLTVHRHRSESVEAAALVRQLIDELAVAVIAFDQTGAVVFTNDSATRLLKFDRGARVPATAESLGCEELLTGRTPRVINATFDGTQAKYEIRRQGFYREGRPHLLLMLTDLSKTLRREEQSAWQRLVRVLSHEINNSLTPIRSIAHSVGKVLGKSLDPVASELTPAIGVIEERAASLGRFIRSYAQLASLPPPSLASVDLGAAVRRVALLENRARVNLHPGPSTTVRADPDQLEQMLVNIIRNAAEASQGTDGDVDVNWIVNQDWVEIHVIDQGEGIRDDSNLFVPFYTTKPGGSGIGLALSRQIADAHNGSLSLVNHDTGRGCLATVRLPRS